MYTLKILETKIIDVLVDGTKQLAVTFEISKDETPVVVQTFGYPVDITKEALVEELTKAKEVFAADAERAANPQQGAGVEKAISDLTGTQL